MRRNPYNRQKIRKHFKLQQAGLVSSPQFTPVFEKPIDPFFDHQIPLNVRSYVSPSFVPSGQTSYDSISLHRGESPEVSYALSSALPDIEDRTAPFSIPKPFSYTVITNPLVSTHLGPPLVVPELFNNPIRTNPAVKKILSSPAGAPASFPYLANTNPSTKPVFSSLTSTPEFFSYPISTQPSVKTLISTAFGNPEPPNFPVGFNSIPRAFHNIPSSIVASSPFAVSSSPLTVPSPKVRIASPLVPSTFYVSHAPLSSFAPSPISMVSSHRIPSWSTSSSGRFTLSPSYSPIVL